MIGWVRDVRMRSVVATRRAGWSAVWVGRSSVTKAPRDAPWTGPGCTGCDRRTCRVA